VLLGPHDCGCASVKAIVIPALDNIELTLVDISFEEIRDMWWVQISNVFTRKPYNAVMLIDKKSTSGREIIGNARASYLYGWTIHRNTVYGDVVLVSSDGDDFCALREPDIELWQRRIEENK
jgi:hypothetical protein